MDARFVIPVADLPTSITFCEIHPPDHFPITVCRYPKAPDLQIRPDELDRDSIAGADILWLTLSGLSEEPSMSAHHAALEARGELGLTLPDLDFRADFWQGAEAARKQIEQIFPDVEVVVGDQTECEAAGEESHPFTVAEAPASWWPDLEVCHGLPAGWDLDRIIRFANVAGAIFASRLQCSTTMPTTEGVEAAMEEIC